MYSHMLKAQTSDEADVVYQKWHKERFTGDAWTWVREMMSGSPALGVLADPDVYTVYRSDGHEKEKRSYDEMTQYYSLEPLLAAILPTLPSGMYQPVHFLSRPSLTPVVLSQGVFSCK